MRLRRTKTLLAVFTLSALALSACTGAGGGKAMRFKQPVVLKVNGGANSGHTAGGIKLNLLPAGVVVRDARHLCIGSGVVADPRKIWWETRPLEKKGHAILPRLLIDERTLVASPSRGQLQLDREQAAFRVQHFQVIGIAIFIAFVGELDSPSQRRGTALQRLAQLCAVAYVRQRILDIPKRILDDLFVIGERLVAPRLGLVCARGRDRAAVLPRAV